MTTFLIILLSILSAFGVLFIVYLLWKAVVFIQKVDGMVKDWEKHPKIHQSLDELWKQFANLKQAYATQAFEKSVEAQRNGKSQFNDLPTVTLPPPEPTPAERYAQIKAKLAELGVTEINVADSPLDEVRKLNEEKMRLEEDYNLAVKE